MPLDQTDKIDALNRKVVALSALVESQTNLVNRFQKKVDKGLKGPLKEQRDTLLWLNVEMKKYQEMETDFNLMKVHFEEVHPLFYDKLKEKGDSLNYKDMRLATFVKMRLTNPEIAFLLNLTHDGIKKAIQRLRKKLNLGASENLREFIGSL